MVKKVKTAKQHAFSRNHKVWKTILQSAHIFWKTGEAIPISNLWLDTGETKTATKT